VVTYVAVLGLLTAASLVPHDRAEDGEHARS
jgi:hypothetical protein